MPSTSIKDTIHGYIELDSFERSVVDSPWFQRLRRVRQNDVASYVYPTMSTSRFEHSLGAMHLAGECLKAALRDSAEPGAKLFLEHLGAELANRLGVHVTGARLVFFALRCVRMYGALHDIGHPPYSHLIEACYEPTQIGLADTQTRHWHETNGAEIVDKLLRTSVAATGEDADVLKVTAHLATKDIMTPALLALKGLVDSLIDVDRMDFVLRDGRNSGSEFGIYDVLRLVNSFRVHVEAVDGHAHTILIRPLHKALSAIESLIQERYKIYRWVLFHHRIMQSRALMRYIVGRTSGDPRFDPHQFQARNYVPPIPPAPGDPKKYEHVLLGDSVVDLHLDRTLRELKSQEGSLGPDDMRLLTALKILILRANLGIPLWKRTNKYTNDRDPDSFESQLREEFTSGSHSPPRLRILNAYGSYSNWVANVLGRENNKKMLSDLVDELNSAGGASEWYLLEVPSFKKTGDDRILVPGPGTGTPQKEQMKPEYLSDLSGIARAVDAAWRDDVHLFAFRFTDREPEEGDRERMKREGRTRLAKTIAELYRTSAVVRDKFELPSGM